MNKNDRDQNWGNITPGRIVTPNELRSDPGTILRGDFGIAAVRYHRPIPGDVQQDIVSLDSEALTRLEHLTSFNYRNGNVQSIYKKPTPITLIKVAEQCLVDFAEMYHLKEANAWFWTTPRRFTAHFDSIPTKIKGYWQLSEEFGLVGYSVSHGKLDIRSMTEDIDADQLQGLLDRGDARKVTLEQGDLIHFNDTFVHASADIPFPSNNTHPIRLLLSSKAFNPR